MKFPTSRSALQCRFNTLNTTCMTVFQECVVTASARLVWLILWRSATPSGTVRLSYHRIADETGLSRRTCIRAVRELTEKQLVKLVKKGYFPDRVNQYAIKIYPKND